MGICRLWQPVRRRDGRACPACPTASIAQYAQYSRACPPASSIACRKAAKGSACWIRHTLARQRNPRVSRMAMQSPSGCQTLSLSGEVEDATDSRVFKCAAAAQQLSSSSSSRVLFAAVRFMGDFHPVLEDSEAAVKTHFHPLHLVNV